MSLVDKFADIVQTEELAFPHTARALAAVTSEAALAAFGKDGPSAEYARLELESRLWGVVEAVAGLPKNDRHTNRVLLAYLQSALSDPKEPSELHTNKWMHTRAAARKRDAGDAGRGNGPVDLDWDGPVRQKRALAPEDAAADHAVFGYVFDLLLAGQADTAAKVCGETNNWVLRAAIQAATADDAPPLLVRTCYAAAQQPGLDKYERGIYGLLSGDTEFVLPLCTSWETQLVAYMSALVRADALLDVKAADIEALDALLPGPALRLASASAILDALAESSNKKIKQESQDFLRQLFAKVVQHNVSSFVGRLGTQLEDAMYNKAPLGGSSIFSDGSKMRVLVHLILIYANLRSKGKQGQPILVYSEELLLSAYLESLLKDKKPHWLPGYARFLGQEVLLKVYSNMLTTITDPGQRALQLQLGRRFGIDMEASVRQAVEIILNNLATPEALGERQRLLPLTGAASVSEDEHRLVNSVGWFTDAGMWDDAAHALVAVVRVFLTERRLRAIITIGEKYSITEIANQALGVDEAERRELRAYGDVVGALQILDEWDEFSASAASKPKSTGDAIVNAGSLALAAILPWLEDTRGASADDAELLRGFRTQYVPYLLLEFMRVLREATFHKDHLRRALEVSVLVADETHRLYELFQESGRLTELIKKCAEIEVEGVDSIWQV